MGRKSLTTLTLALYSTISFLSPVNSFSEQKNAQESIIDKGIQSSKGIYGFNQICQNSFNYTKEHKLEALFEESEEKAKLREDFKKTLKKLNIHHKGDSKNYLLLRSTLYLQEKEDIYEITVSLYDILTFKCENADNFIKKLGDMSYGKSKFYSISINKKQLK